MFNTFSLTNHSSGIPLDFGSGPSKPPLLSTSDFFDFPPPPGGPGGALPSLSNQLTLKIIPSQIVNFSFLRGSETLKYILDTLGNLLSPQEQAVPTKSFFASKTELPLSSKCAFSNLRAFGEAAIPQTTIQCYMLKAGETEGAGKDKAGKDKAKVTGDEVAAKRERAKNKPDKDK